MRRGLRRALLTSAINPPLLGNLDPRLLPLSTVLQFDLSQPEQHARHHPPNRPAQVDLLGNDHHTNSTFAPVGQQANAFVLTPGNAVELPHDDGVNLAIKDRLLHPIERGPFERLAALAILEPLNVRRLDAVAGEPVTDLGLLAVVLLAT